jgi:hypothetical protein
MLYVSLSSDTRYLRTCVQGTWYDGWRGRLHGQLAGVFGGLWRRQLRGEPIPDLLEECL